MDFKVGEVIKMKKKHPCGANEWKLLRVGMDFRLQCMKCGREVMVPRKLVEKNFRGYQPGCLICLICLMVKMNKKRAISEEILYSKILK